MKQSEVVNEWLQEGRAEGRVEGRAEGRTEGQRLASVAAVVAVLEARFGQVPTDLAVTINAATNLNTIQGWVPLAAKVASLDEFRKITLG